MSLGILVIRPKTGRYLSDTPNIENQKIDFDGPLSPSLSRDTRSKGGCRRSADMRTLRTVQIKGTARPDPTDQLRVSDVLKDRKHRVGEGVHGELKEEQWEMEQ